MIALMQQSLKTRKRSLTKKTGLASYVDFSCDKKIIKKKKMPITRALLVIQSIIKGVPRRIVLLTIMIVVTCIKWW